MRNKCYGRKEMLATWGQLVSETDGQDAADVLAKLRRRLKSLKGTINIV